MPIIRRKLAASDVYPDDIRYNEMTGTVQRNVNGVWEDAPESDPRQQTTLPPRLTADTRCDAAASVADALANQISEILTAIDNAGTAFTIAGIILSLLSFGVFAIFVSIALAIADAMLGYGTAAIEAALPPSAFDALKCILECHMDGQGRLKEGELPAVQSEVTTQIGGIGASIINSMLSLAGEGGINNLASLGTSTGDCSACGCEDVWCYEWNFLTDDGGFTAAFGTWSFGVGWTGTTAGTGKSIVLTLAIATTTFTHVEITLDYNPRGNALVKVGAVNTVNFSNVLDGTYSWDGSATDNDITVNPSSGVSQGNSVILTGMLMRGTGANPFGSDNCI